VILARKIGIDSKDAPSCLARLVAWTRRHVGYTREGVELLQDPRVTLRYRSGDCDDHACLVVALALAIGIKARLATIAIAGREAHHIIPVIVDHGAIVVFDSTRTAGENRRQVDRLDRGALNLSLDGVHR